MFVLVACVAIVLMLRVLHQVKHRKRNLAFSKFPTPKKHFLIHNCLQMVGVNNAKIINRIEKWEKQLGEVFLFTIHPFDCGTIFVSDPAIAEAVSFHQPDRTRSILYKSVGRWIGKDGFFLSSCEVSKKLLKPLLYNFNPKFHEKYAKIMNSHMNEVLENLKKSNEPVEISDAFSFARKVVLDTSFDILMNFKLDSKNEKNLGYLTSIEKFSKLAMVAIYDIRGRSDLLFPFTKFCREEKKHLKVLQDFTMNIVKNRRQQMLDGAFEGHHCVLDHYLQTQLGGQPFTDLRIREEFDTMLLGSHDTTRSTFGFLLYILAKHPDIQQKVYEETCMYLKDNPNNDLLEKDVGNLVYTECVIKEALRLFPPFPFLGRKLQSEITVGEFTFPKDVEIIISPYLIGRNAKYFEDPLAFKPERFFGDEPLLAYTPFSIGARKCIGGKFAMLGLKIALSKIIRNVKVSLPPGEDNLALVCELILKPRFKVPLVMELRRE